jgi:flagellar hook-associated protein 2
MPTEDLFVGTTPTSPLTPITFTGVSPYATDFQSVLNRAVAIAQLPITALQNQESDISDKEQLATGIQSAVANLATTVTNLGNLGTNGGISGSSSNTALAQVDNTSMTTPGTFQISQISSLAAAASVTTTNGYADATTTPVSSTGTMQLVINGKAVTPNINLTGSGQNNLNGLASAINALNAGVTATVIDTGTGSTPYYLSISDNSTGQNNIQLFDDPSGADTQIALSGSSGSNANFDVNGQPVTSTTNTISNVIPGMTFTLEGTTTGTQSVTLTAATEPSQISNLLQTLVSQYNSIQQLLQAQIGPNAGLLLGNSMIDGVNMALSGLLNYRGTGTGVENLADLGIELSQTGVMSFNQSTFSALTSSQIQSAFTFLGSSITGFGALAGTLTAYSDPTKGEIAGQENEWKTDTTNINNQISTFTAQANQMQKTLDAALQSADEQIAQMQSQQQALTATIQSLDFTSFGYNQNAPTATASSSSS